MTKIEFLIFLLSYINMQDSLFKIFKIQHNLFIIQFIKKI